MAAVLRSLLVCLMCIPVICFGEETNYGQLVQRLDILEVQGIRQAEQLRQQAFEIRQLKEQVKSQNMKILHQQRRTVAYHQRLSKRRHDGHQQTSALRYTGLDGMLDVRAAPVAFHAVIQAHNVTKLQVNQTIAFPEVLTNVGDSYSKDDGIFTAPVAGLYLFSLTIEAMPHVYVELGIMKNDKALAYAFASGYRGDKVYDQGSVTVISQLAVGDRIWPSVFNPPDTALWGEGFSSFMGCLITTV